MKLKLGFMTWDEIAEWSGFSKRSVSRTDRDWCGKYLAPRAEYEIVYGGVLIKKIKEELFQLEEKIKLNFAYSTEDLARVLHLTKESFRERRPQYEQYLSLFYDFTKTYDNPRGEAKYIFHRQLREYIPRQVIAYRKKEVSKREVAAPDIKVPKDLVPLIEQGAFASKERYNWVGLKNDKYILLSPEQIAELRKYLNPLSLLEEEENIWVDFTQGKIPEKVAFEKVGIIRQKAFLEGLDKFRKIKGIQILKK